MFGHCPTYTGCMWGVCMFLVLKTEPFPRARNLFVRLFQKPKPPELSRVAVRGGAYFYSAVLHADKHGKTDFSALMPLGGCVQRIVPDGALPPLPAPFAVFRPRFFPAHLFLQTALQYLRQQAAGAPLPLLGISDRNGLLANCIPPFADVAVHIRIFTAAPQRYAAVCEQVFCEQGLPLILSDSEAALQSCTVQLYPFAENAAPYFPGRLVYAAGDAAYAGAELTLPEELEARRPPGADALQFVSALCELCNVPLPKTLCYDTLQPIKSGEIY